MAGKEGKTSGIEKFDGTDFGYWKMQIEDYLYGKKLYLSLLGRKPNSMEEEEWSLLDRQVLGYTINSNKIKCTQRYEGKDHSGSDEGFV